MSSYTLSYCYKAQFSGWWDRFVFPICQESKEAIRSVKLSSQFEQSFGQSDLKWGYHNHDHHMLPTK